MQTENQWNFEQIYVTYFSKMKRFAQEYVQSGEEAENIVHDVFLELWERKELLSYHINILAFLFTAIKNKCIDYLRHEIVVKEASSQMQEEFLLTMQMKYKSLELFDQNMFNEKDIEEILQNAIQKLPDRCREIFIKSKIEGKKQKEIAVELNISVNTVETQIGLAYKRLREELKDFIPLVLFLLFL